MRFSEDFIQKVMEANNIVDIISQYTQLKPSGGGLMGRCPFPDHQEKSPSFSVSETKQVYHCFGCHKSGNIFTFMRDYYGYAFPEAVEFLANRANIPLPKTEQARPEEDRQALRRKEIYRANEITMKFFVEELKRARADSPVKAYVAKRGLTQDTIDAFNIGFAPKEWDALVLHLKSKGVSESVAEEARLITARKEGKSGHFDMFRNRLMFPILNTMGQVVAFGGRVLDPEDNPKYLNSPETPVFEKKKVLYGLNQTGRFIRSEDAALVVEGYMDAVSLYQAGVKNVAAVMSSSLTPEQTRLIKRMTRQVLMLLDGDAAGIDGAVRSLPILLGADVYPKAVILPEGQDPDDFVKARGVEALQELLKGAQELFFLVLSQWMEGYRGDPTEKVKLADKLKPLFETMPDARLRELYLQETARRMGVQEAWLFKAVGVMGGGNRPLSASSGAGFVRTSQRAPFINAETVEKSGSVVAESPENENKVSLLRAPAAELLVLQYSLKSRANFEIFTGLGVLDFILHDGVRKLLTRAVEVYGQDRDRFDKLVSLLVSTVEQPELLFPRELTGAKATEEFDAEKEEKLLRDAVKRVRENNLKERFQKLKQELAADPSPEKLAQLAELQREISSLTKGSGGT